MVKKYILEGILGLLITCTSSIFFFGVSVADSSPGGTVTQGDGEDEVGSNPTSQCCNVTDVPYCCPECDVDCDSYGSGSINTMSDGCSYVDNVYANYHHPVYDYRSTGSGGSSCNTCGGGAPSDSLLNLSVYRHHRYRESSRGGLWGPGVFSGFDRRLVLYQDNGVNVIEYFDPKDIWIKRFKDGANGDPKDGIFVDQTNKSIVDLRLYDASSQLTTNIYAAKTAVVTHKSGKKSYFDIVNVGAKASVPVVGAAPWRKSDVGRTALIGDTTYNAGTFTLQGAGRDIWNQQDEMHYCFQALRGDGSITAKVESQMNTDPWAKTGVMIRESLADGSKFALTCVTPGNGTAFQRRKTTLASALHTAGPAGVAPYWVRLTRTGNTFLGEVSSDGITWSTVGSDTISMGQDVFVGIGDTAHHDGLINTAVVDNVSLTGTPTPAAEWPTEGIGGTLNGRWTRWEDRNGYALTLTYKNFTSAQLAAAPDLQLELDTVTDPHGRTATFTYNPLQQSGLWVPSRIDLPNGQNLQYQYTDGKLSGITLPDGTQSTFSYGFNARAQCTTIAFDDAAADTTHRRKTVYLTNNIFIFSMGEDVAEVVNQSSLLARLVVNGNNEVVYFNVTNPHHSSHNENLIYEGTGKARLLHAYWTSRYFKDGWKMTNPALGYDGFTFQIEDTFESTPVDHTAMQLGTYTQKTDEHGVTTTFSYDNDACVTQKNYPDGTNEQWAYNSFKEVVRYKDRLNRVVRKSYDSRGNLLTKEVGILFDGANDVNQPEYGVWKWEYYPAGHVNQFLLKTEFDALYNPSLADMHRTDMEYNAQQLLVKKTEGADIAGGVRAETTYEYDSAGRLVRTKAPPAGFGLPTRDVAYVYDQRDRVIQIIHESDIPAVTSESFVYGTGANANLLVQKTDRLGHIEKWEYDQSGRQTKHIQAFGLPEQIEKTCVYLPGTTLKTACVDRGEKTDYTYDYRHRVKTTTQHPNSLNTLTTTNTYSKNLLFATQDPYGRKSYNAYRSSDSALVRTAQGTMPAFSLADFNAVMVQARDLGNNASYLISDYEVDAGGQTTAMVDPRNIRHTSTYNSRGQLVQRVEAESVGGVATTVQGKTEFDYDAQGNQIRIRNPRHFTEAGGFITEMMYGGRNLLASKTEAKARAEEATETYSYTPHRQIYLRTDPRGNVWETGYHKCCGYQRIDIEPAADVDGNSGTADTKAAFESNKDSYGHTTHQYVISDVSTLSTPADPASTLNETTTRLDGLYRPSAQTRWFIELGNVNKNDVPIAGDHGTNISDGLTTRYRYDENLTDGVGIDADYASKLAQLGVGFFGTGADGYAVEVTNPNNEKSVTVYDGAGRVVLTIDGNGNTNRMVYDSVIGSGLLETVTYDGLNHTIKQRADGAGRVRETVDSEGFIGTQEYDANRNIVKSRNPNGVGLDSVYDERNRKSQCTDTHGDTSKNVYDANNNLVKKTDALNKDNVCVFDPRDRKVLCIDSISGTTLWMYDSNNNPTQVTDAEGQISKWVFDQRNLAVEERLPDNLLKGVAYDAAHRRIKRIDQAGDVTTYNYDRIDRLTARNYPDSLNDTFTYDQANRLLTAVSMRYNNLVSRTWDASGRRISESLQIDSNVYMVSNDYDSANRRTRILYPTGNLVNCIYTARDQLQNLKWNGTDVATRVYDPSMRLNTTTFGNNLVETRTYQTDNLLSTLVTPGVTNFAYSWDANKRKLSENDTIIPGNNQNYTYDSEGRINAFTRSNGQFQNWNLSLVGDWTAFNDNGSLQNRTHGTVHQLNQINATPLAYDLKGNLTQNSNGDSYQWDYENKMKLAKVGLNSISYSYDALGRRVKKMQSGITTIIVWDDRSDIVEYLNGGIAKEYIYGADSDEMLMVYQGGLKTYFHSNDLYSVAALTNSAGNVVERYKYDPYGKVIILNSSGSTPIANSTIDNHKVWQGLTNDSETHLTFNRSRLLDHNLGRYLSRDRLGYVNGMGLYSRYSIMNTTDPLGTKTCTPKKIYGDDYQDGDEKGGFPSYFKISVWASATDAELQLHSWVFSKAYRVFWVRWGTASVTVHVNIKCDEDCKPFTDAKGKKEDEDSISKAAVDWKEEKEGDVLTIRETLGSGSSQASGGPKFKTGKEGVGEVEIEWPEAAWASTFTMGTFKWKCECVEKKDKK